MDRTQKAYDGLGLGGKKLHFGVGGVPLQPAVASKDPPAPGPWGLTGGMGRSWPLHPREPSPRQGYHSSSLPHMAHGSSTRPLSTSPLSPPLALKSAECSYIGPILGNLPVCWERLAHVHFIITTPALSFYPF